MRIMCLTHNVRRFFALDFADQWLVVRAIARLAIARLQVAFVPFERLAASLSASPSPGEQQLDPDLLGRIQFAVAVAAAHVPWRSDCFPQAIAGRALLRSYGYPSIIHLGVEQSGDDALGGHAWLTCGSFVVTGGDDLDSYTEIHHFSA